MTRNPIFLFAIATTMTMANLSGANVSVVNQSATGGATSAPSAAGGTTTTPVTTPATQSQQKVGANLTGKLPPSKSASTTSSSRKPKAEAPETFMHPEEPTYTYPGLLAKLGRRWVGSDYLYNMHQNIGIVIEVVLQEGKDISVDKDGLKGIIADAFGRIGLVPEALASENTPPLPFFHVLIFAFPSENSTVAFVSGRLFEDALLARYGLDPIGTWQAISWEKQDLVVTSPMQFDAQLKKSVSNIAQTFTERVEMYSKIKEESESNAKIYYPKVIPEPPKQPKQ